MSQMQPEPESSSDGDGSWTEHPLTQDPDEDRSVDAVIRRTSQAEDRARHADTAGDEADESGMADRADRDGDQGLPQTD